MEITINSKFRKSKDRITNHILQKHCDISVLELRGFIASVICEPNEIEYHEWLDMLGISATNTNFSDDEAIAQDMIKYAKKCFIDIRNKLEHGIYNPVSEINQLLIIKDDEQLRGIATAWSYGFLTGVGLGFLASLTEKQKSKLFLPMTILTLEDEELEQSLKKHNINKTIDNARQDAVRLLANAINEIYQFWLDGKHIPDMQGTNNNEIIENNDSFDEMSVAVH